MSGPRPHEISLLGWDGAARLRPGEGSRTRANRARRLGARPESEDVLYRSAASAISVPTGIGCAIRNLRRLELTGVFPRSRSATSSCSANDFSDANKSMAPLFSRVAGAGVVGGSIEDYSGSGIYDFKLAVERIAACADAVSQLSFPFTLTARAENLLRGVNDLNDIIKRLQAFEAAGADVLYAPGLCNLDPVKQVIDSVNKPVNVLFAFMPDVSLEQYAELGVRRISIGGALANYASGAILTASKQMLTSGRFDLVKDAASGTELKTLLTSR